jgi:hypothetical protein
VLFVLFALLALFDIAAPPRFPANLPDEFRYLLPEGP